MHPPFKGLGELGVGQGVYPRLHGDEVIARAAQGEIFVEHSHERIEAALSPGRLPKHEVQDQPQHSPLGIKGDALISLVWRAVPPPVVALDPGVLAGFRQALLPVAGMIEHVVDHLPEHF